MFGAHIIFKGAMPVKMVRRNVGDNSNMNAQTFNGFELKTGKFGNRPCRIIGFLNQTGQRGADIAADNDVCACRPHQFAN